MIDPKILPLLKEAETLLRLEVKHEMDNGTDRLQLQTLSEALNNTSQAIYDLLSSEIIVA